MIFLLQLRDISGTLFLRIDIDIRLIADSSKSRNSDPLTLLKLNCRIKPFSIPIEKQNPFLHINMQSMKCQIITVA